LIFHLPASKWPHVSAQQSGRHCQISVGSHSTWRASRSYRSKEEAIMKAQFHWATGHHSAARAGGEEEGRHHYSDTAERPSEGEVIAVGKGRRNTSGERMELEVKKGDRVLFSKYAGTEIEIESNKCLVMKEEDILAIL
jgi:chaperonin GroES